jgi:small nuclear ribonucleoprotein (snRNP)-like protein
MGNLVMKYRGQAVEVIDRDGRVYRGVIDGVNQQRGMFLRTGFRRRSIPFFLIAAIFLLRGRRRIF